MTTETKIVEILAPIFKEAAEAPERFCFSSKNAATISARALTAAGLQIPAAPGEWEKALGKFKRALKDSRSEYGLPQPLEKAIAGLLDAAHTLPTPSHAAGVREGLEMAVETREVAYTEAISHPEYCANCGCVPVKAINSTLQSYQAAIRALIPAEAAKCQLSAESQYQQIFALKRALMAAWENRGDEGRLWKIISEAVSPCGKITAEDEAWAKMFIADMEKPIDKSRNNPMNEEHTYLVIYKDDSFNLCSAVDVSYFANSPDWMMTKTMVEVIALLKGGGEPAKCPAPERKVVQIATTGVQNNAVTQFDYVVYALCDDGAVFNMTNATEWRALPPIPQGIAP